MDSKSKAFFVSLYIKDARAIEEKEERTKRMTGKAIQELKNNKSIRNAPVGKLAVAVKQTIKSIVDGEQVTEETVKELIDMDKLSYGHPEVQRTEESRQQYAAAVLNACRNAAL